ncbi:HNH endonuclease [Franconibacter sp. IITDAS19]|uniref:HNH endonuclease n=1 Tax=Franconibacter sp. IITDAS19 TaxID=2930569 RepID=UPI001FF995B2|nr:HNH endonuclease [Franconibacter sp. IITDAS19]MCK1967394.1 HNH endonuclease [Franconibacter sp. IITDAS19]
MSFSLPGCNLFYLLRDNLEPEYYELIAQPYATWHYIQQEYEFDDRYHGHYYIEGLRPHPQCSRNYAHQSNYTYGLNTHRRMRELVFNGDIVMLDRIGPPGQLFYIDEQGELICTNPWAFERNGAENIIRAFTHSVKCRCGSRPRTTRFARSVFEGVSGSGQKPAYQTINSKAAGRLLAAGGVYNNNVDAFRETAERLGGDALKGYEQVLNEQTAGAVMAAASMLLVKRPANFEEIYGYLGKIRGESKFLHNLEVKEINYVKRESAEAALMRKEFNNVVRKSFLHQMASSSEAAAVFNSSDILKMRQGAVPDGWNVHHKLPLDDSGDNSFDNLALIENEPFHKVLTGMQRQATKGMVPGESRIIPWVMPATSIYRLK